MRVSIRARVHARRGMGVVIIRIIGVDARRLLLRADRLRFRLFEGVGIACGILLRIARAL